MIEIRLFGPTTVRHDAAFLSGTGFGGRKPRDLLGLLALGPGGVHRRDDVAEELWEGSPPASYVTTLQGYVSVLRRQLATIGAERCLVSVPGGYTLAPELVTVDLGAARDALRRGDAPSVLAAVAASAAGLFPEVGYSRWADRARWEWDEELAAVAGRAAAEANRVGDHLDALRLAQAAAARSPYSEVALRELMRALAALGNGAEALQRFHDARVRWQEDLGVEPDPATTALYLDLLRASRGDPRREVPVLLSLLRDALDLEAGPTPWSEREARAHVGQLLLSRAT